MLIPLDRIFEDDHNVRRIKSSDQADAQLRDSIAARGLLQAITVRPDGDRFAIVYGRRRLAACRALGYTEIEATLREVSGADATADQMAENVVRAQMHPVDQWRAIVRMQAEGYSLDAAASCLGFGERHARKLDRLGHLHPSIVKLIEEHGLPNDRELGTIANAPPKTQAAAAKKHAGNWWRLAEACDTEQLSRNEAIFDTSLMKWDEDLFAEPGSHMQFTTTDTPKFWKLQTEALAQLVADLQARKVSAQIIEAHRDGYLELPKGWQRSYAGTVDKPKKNETVFHGIDANGRLARILAIDPKAEKQREREKAAKAKASGIGAVDLSDPDSTPEPDAPETIEARPVISKAGLEVIAKAKTQALRDRVRAVSTGAASTAHMLQLMILLLAAQNVRLDYSTNMDELAAQLLGPNGDIAITDEAAVRKIAGEALARILLVGPGVYLPSGPAAEWIGVAIGADNALPRFDTPEFLAHVSGAELRRLATEADIKATGSVSGLRQKLAGELPDWCPATFGAPAPEVVADDGDPIEQDEAA